MKTGHAHTDTVINFLVQQPRATSKQVIARLQQSVHKISQAQCYNIINRLLEQRMIVKSQGKLSLHQQRLAGIEQFLTQSKKSRQQSRLQPGEKRSYHATTLAALDDIRANVTAQSFAHSSGDALYYDKHPYHILAVREKEQEVLQTIRQSDRVINYRIGGATFLDLHGTKLLQTCGCHVTSVGREYYPEHFIAIIGDYTQTLVLPPMIDQYFEMFFVNICSIDDFHPELFASIFHMKGDFTLKIARKY